MTSPGTAAAPAPVAFAPETLVDDSEFLGVIVVDEMVNGNYGPQWHFAIKPVDYNLSGESKTGAYQQYVPADKPTLRSKFGIALSAFLTVFGQGFIPAVGAGHLVGVPAMFKRVNHKFGKDRQTREDIVVEMLLPIRTATEEEQKRASSRLEGQVTNTATNAATFSDEQVASLVKVLAGCTPQEVAVKIARDKSLDNNLKGAVLNGTAVPALLQKGVLGVDGDGKYVALDAS